MAILHGCVLFGVHLVLQHHCCTVAILVYAYTEIDCSVDAVDWRKDRPIGALHGAILLVSLQKEHHTITDALRTVSIANCV